MNAINWCTGILRRVYFIVSPFFASLIWADANPLAMILYQVCGAMYLHFICCNWRRTNYKCLFVGTISFIVALSLVIIQILSHILRENIHTHTDRENQPTSKQAKQIPHVWHWIAMSLKSITMFFFKKMDGAAWARLLLQAKQNRIYSSSFCMFLF